MSATNVSDVVLPSGIEPDRPRRERVGMTSLIATESAFFATLLVVYLYYIGKNISGPLPREVLDLPIIATVCLLSSSFTIVLAMRGLRAGRLAAFRGFWLLTILLGLAFLGFTAAEWYRLITVDQLTIGTNLFGSTFYTLVGFHAGHVTIGVLLLSLVLVLALRGSVRPENAEHVEMLSWYWHFVDTVWVAVFTVVYVVGR